MNGKTMTITSRRPLADDEAWCRTCHGRGMHDMTMYMCDDCKGKGRVKKEKGND